MPFKLPDGYEVNTDENHEIQRGERFYHSDGAWDTAKSIAGHSIKTIYEVWGKDYIFIKKIEKPKTPEEKIKLAKIQAWDFVNRNIPNATEKDFQNFESAFQREDNFGL